MDFLVSLAGPGVKGDTLSVEQYKRILELQGMTASMTVSQMRQSIKEDFRMRAQPMPWMQWFLDYDPSDDIRNTRCPVFALNGDLDCQVISSQNLPAIRIWCVRPIQLFGFCLAFLSQRFDEQSDE